VKEGTKAKLQLGSEEKPSRSRGTKEFKKNGQTEITDAVKGKTLLIESIQEGREPIPVLYTRAGHVQRDLANLHFSFWGAVPATNETQPINWTRAPGMLILAQVIQVPREGAVKREGCGKIIRFHCMADFGCGKTRLD